MTEMQPVCGASPARDRDSLSNLSGTFNFTSGSHAVSVSVIIGAPGDNEGQANNFNLLTREDGGTWVLRADDTQRPSNLSTQTTYAAAKSFAVKVTFDQVVVDGNGNPTTNPPTVAQRERSVSVTAPHDPPRGNTLNEEMDVTLT